MNRFFHFSLPLLFYTGFCFLGASSLGAQDKKNKDESKILQITRETCLKLLSYQSDGMVEYKPGIDVHGGAVVGADINAPQFTLPESFDIPIEINLQERQGLARSLRYLGAMQIGTVTLDRKGRAYLNGQALFHEDEAALRPACKEKLLMD